MVLEGQHLHVLGQGVRARPLEATAANRNAEVPHSTGWSAADQLLTIPTSASLHQHDHKADGVQSEDGAGKPPTLRGGYHGHEGREGGQPQQEPVTRRHGTVSPEHLQSATRPPDGTVRPPVHVQEACAETGPSCA